MSKPSEDVQQKLDDYNNDGLSVPMGNVQWWRDNFIAMEKALETIGGMDLDADDAPEFAANTANAAIGEVNHDVYLGAPNRKEAEMSESMIQEASPAVVLSATVATVGELASRVGSSIESLSRILGVEPLDVPPSEPAVADKGLLPVLQADVSAAERNLDVALANIVCIAKAIE